MTVTDYQTIRSNLRPGDIVAFSGKGVFSAVIKLFTSTMVSHVGIVRRTKLMNDAHEPLDGEVVELIESTTLNGNQGVQETRMSQRVAGYKGSIWVFPLGDAARTELRLPVFYDFLMHEVGKPYDWLQAILSAGLPFQIDSSRARFCSEVAAAALKAAGVSALRNYTPSDLDPIELLRVPGLYAAEYFQIKGKQQKVNL